MKLLIALSLAGTSVTPFSITLDQSDNENWSERRIKQIPKPVLGAVADHLHTIASLFSSLIGTGAYKDDDTSDALDCQHTTYGHGPYCIFSYDDKQECYQEFGCEFYDAGLKFASESSQAHKAKLCCFKNWEEKEFESSFAQGWSEEQDNDHDHAFRYFQANQNNVGKVYDIEGKKLQVVAGHYGLAEVIYTPNPKPDTTSHIIDQWNECPFSDTVGYHSVDLMPTDYKKYSFKEFDGVFAEDFFSLCTVEGNGTKIEMKSNQDVKTLMPYCTFKLIGQDCPPEAPLMMNFDHDATGHKLPNDKLYEAVSYIDSSSFCCAKSNHDTHERTIINIDYLTKEENENIYDFFKTRYQFLKWPHAECAMFEHPKFDLTENVVKLTGKETYPWEFADMELTFCTYTEPVSLDDLFVVRPTDNNAHFNVLDMDHHEEDEAGRHDEVSEFADNDQGAALPSAIPESDGDFQPTEGSVLTGNYPEIKTVDDHVPEYTGFKD